MKSQIVSLLALHDGKDVKRVDAKKKNQEPFVAFLKKDKTKDKAKGVSEAKVKLNKKKDKTYKVEVKEKKKKSSKSNTQLEGDVALLLEQSKNSKNKVKKSSNEHSKNIKTDVTKKKGKAKKEILEKAKALTSFSHVGEKEKPKENKSVDGLKDVSKADEEKNIKDTNSKLSQEEKTFTSANANFNIHGEKDAKNEKLKAVKVEEKKTSNALHDLFVIKNGKSNDKAIRNEKNDNEKNKVMGKEKLNSVKNVNIAKSNTKNNVKESDQKRASSNEMAKNFFVNSKDERKDEKKNETVKRLNSTSSLKGTIIKEDEKLKSLKNGNSNQFQKNSHFREKRQDFENVVVKITKGSQKKGHMKVNFSKVHLHEKIEYVRKHELSKDYGSLPQLNREKEISQVVKNDVTNKTSQTPKNISTQVVTAISKALENQRPPLKIQIQLNPPQLGKVIIEVTEKAGKTSLLLSVENDKTRELMKMALPIMTNQLSNLNFNVTNVQINGQQWFDTGQGHQEQKREQNERKKEERGNNFNEEYKEFRKEEV